MNGRYLFDTNVIIYYLQGRSEWVEFIDGTTMTERYASVITRMELLSYPGIKPEEENRIYRFLSDLQVMPLDDKLEHMAIALRRSTRLKLPDAIVAATAITLGATLITGEKHLSGLNWPSLETIKPF